MPRAIASVLCAAIAIVGCRGAGVVSPETSSALAASGATVSVIAAVDLPRDDARTRELSGIAWEASTRTLYAISDTVPEIVPLRPSADYRAWSIGEPIAVRVPDAWDGEGIVLTANGFFIANERGPHIDALDRTGALVRELPLPACYERCVRNKALESLTTTEDGRYLFTANESTLRGDGTPPSTTEGATVRILRRDLVANTDTEFAYRTDPIFAEGARSDMGVSEMLAVSKNDILVLERSYVPGIGNTVRLYRAALDGHELADGTEIVRSTPVLPKRLFLDFETLPGADIAGEGKHHLPNYEGLAFGPMLDDGRRVLFVISDDNANPALVARILTLAISL